MISETFLLPQNFLFRRNKSAIFVLQKSRARIMPDGTAETNLVATESGTLTKATVRAAQNLGLKPRTLSAVIGLSEPTISRMNNGKYLLERTNKAFELSALFVRLYRSLDAIVSGDQNVARGWLNSQNSALGDAPINLIQHVNGLVDVIQYLDARRAQI
jgi:hypothetical protein